MTKLNVEFLNVDNQHPKFTYNLPIRKNHHLVIGEQYNL
jgi:hypothetical protein